MRSVAVLSVKRLKDVFLLIVYWYLHSDVSGQPVAHIFKAEALQEERIVWAVISSRYRKGASEVVGASSCCEEKLKDAPRLEMLNKTWQRQNWKTSS